MYTIWCDDRGLRRRGRRAAAPRAGRVRPDRGRAQPRATSQDLVGPPRQGRRSRTSREDWAVLSAPGPARARILAGLVPAVEALPYFGHHAAARSAGCPVTISRTGYTGDLGYEVWVKAENALPTWDAIWEATPRVRRAAVRAAGAVHDPDRGGAAAARRRLRVTAGSPGPTPTGRRPTSWAWAGCSRASTPTTGAFIGRDAIRRELADKTSRFRTTGIVVDWRDWDRIHDEAGLIPPKDHTPVQEEMFLYDDDGDAGRATRRASCTPRCSSGTSASRRVPLDVRASPGSKVYLEVPVSHRYVHVAAQTARMPLYNPERRTA